MGMLAVSAVCVWYCPSGCDGRGDDDNGYLWDVEAVSL